MEVSLNFGDFAWPLITLILGGVFLWMFKEEIRDLIRSIREVGPKGVVIGKEQEVAESPSSPEGQELLKDLNSALLQELEDAIVKGLDDHNVKDSARREEILVKYLAANQLGWYFERVSARIFASQVEALRYINSQPNGAEREDLRDIYKNWFRDSATRKRFPLEQWLLYPLSEQLIREDDGRLKITVRGRDFLSYLVHWGHSGPLYT